MEQFVEFITHHWMLSSGLLIVLISFLTLELWQQGRSSNEITPEFAVHLINHQEAVILDIRTKPVFLEGHIVGSLSIPEQDLEAKMETLVKYFTKPVIVVCNVGQSATRVAALLKQKGFLQALVLKGGIQNWKTMGMPLVKS